MGQVENIMKNALGFEGDACSEESVGRLGRDRTVTEI